MKVRIHYQIKSEADAYTAAKNNTSARNNFIRVDDHLNSPDPYKANRSEIEIGGNTAFFVTTDDLGRSTTAPHEYGHGLGLVHYNDETPPVLTLIGAGQPGIMAGRGTPVDPPYRYPTDPTNPTVYPYSRKVLQSDIQKAFNHLNYNLNTKQWEIGNANNNFFANDSDQTTDLRAVKQIEESAKAFFNSLTTKAKAIVDAIKKL